MSDQMLHPRRFALERPDHPAVIMGESGEVVTYRQLDAEANQLAHLLREHGLGVGDHAAIISESTRDSFSIAWGMQQAGLIYTPINQHLRAREIDAVLADCGARVVVATDHTRALLTEFDGTVVFMRDASTRPTAPVDDEAEGREMIYSGGTTGRPKGVRKPMANTPIGDPSNPAVQTSAALDGYGINANSVYLCPAPLYHAAPLVFSMAVQRRGGTVVLMERFDPSRCLELIAEYRVSHAQFVPTMFTRILKLPESERAAADTSSLQLAIHAAAPCPVEIKRSMIEWWGPILFEYYAGTEDIGQSSISSAEWLEHPGSVGIPAQPVHILDDDGLEVEPGSIGVIWFDGGREFAYHNDPERTAAAANDRGWRTLGDIGHLDADGYLYLTDRIAHTIISGGVNIYPQEIEDILIVHPKVADVAVIGVPNEDLGEEVRAVVQVLDAADESDELAAELLDLCRSQIATLKCPRQIDFDPALPRDPNGKLFKRLLRDRYWEGHDSHVV